MRIDLFAKCIAFLTFLFAPGASVAAPACGGDFATWLQEMKQGAVSQGVGPRGLSALDGISPDPAVLRRDRNQGVFRQTFEQFGPHRVAPLLNTGANKLRSMPSFFDQVEAQTGVPGPVLVAIWGLETIFGADNGNFATVRSLATLAHDCRRSERFREELIDALKIVDSGLMSSAAMRGAWAGEIGQTQFMPSAYLKFANGSDLVHSSRDALAATARYLKGYGWAKGAGWEPGQPNFSVLKQWNASDVYARTIAYFATRLNEVVR